ncbi:thioredoxin-like [Discoglossus pictus]
MVKDIKSMDNYKMALNESENCLLVISFTAKWCGPCQKIKPFYEELSKKYRDVLFYNCDVDDVDDVASECGINRMPTFLFYKDEEKVYELLSVNAAALEKKIQELK